MLASLQPLPLSQWVRMTESDKAKHSREYLKKAEARTLLNRQWTRAQAEAEG